ncbi:MAG: GlsB/YeaQ/YmgE family stress response membrane protein [Chloroflexi bacterium]|nr:GlsB/YeaQ/YmgE family stress response membrane protein [Chloroflexota bacterium]
MGILSWLVVGLIAGWLAGAVMRGGGYGLLGDVIIGFVGALVGGFLATALFNIHDAVTGINLPTIIVAFLGALVTISVLRLIARPMRGL